MCPPGKGEGTRACTGKGFRRQTRPGRPEGKNFYTHTPARALRREGRPIRPWWEAHSLSTCPDGQRLRLRTRKPDPIAHVLHPRSDNTRCCPVTKESRCVPLKGGKDPRQRVGGPLPAPGESMYTRTKYQQGRRPSPPCRGGCLLIPPGRTFWAVRSIGAYSAGGRACCPYG